MTGKDLFNAILSVDEEFVEKAECGALSENDGGGKTRFGALPHKKLVAAAVCTVVIISLAGGLFSLHGRTDFVLTAYANGTDGEPVSSEMVLNKDIPVSVFDYGGGLRSFKFSYKNDNYNEKPHFTTVYAPSCSPADDMTSFSIIYSGTRASVMNGNVYIDYVFREECDSYAFTYQTVPDKENNSYSIQVRIDKKNGEYFARLEKVKEQKTGTDSAN